MPRLLCGLLEEAARLARGPHVDVGEIRLILGKVDELLFELGPIGVDIIDAPDRSPPWLQKRAPARTAPTWPEPGGLNDELHSLVAARRRS